MGPDLDEAFRYGREDGFRESTIRAIVEDQIRYPASAEASPRVPAMPPNLVQGDDVDAVASYVASVAGIPGTGGGAAAGGGQETTDPKILFTANCGTCHVLEKAGTTGTTGPNLDQTNTSRQEAERQIRNGGGGMPAFGDQLTGDQIDALARYVSGRGR